MAQQIIQFGTDLQDPGGRVLRHDIVCNLGDECFPVRWRDQGLVGDSFTFEVVSSAMTIWKGE